MVTAAPPVADRWPERVVAFAQDLRGAGARWVVALLHDGVTWWPSGESIGTRSDRLDALAAPWAHAVDAIVGGHNFGYGLVIVELQPGELDTVRERHAAAADPRARETDALWWNWCRMPAGLSVGAANPTSVALVAGNVALLESWLDRDLSPTAAPVTARDALIQTI
jgi:hypothetical protein